MKISLLLRIRWWQVRKELKGAGTFYALLLLLAGLLFTALAYSRYQRQQDAFITAGIILILVNSCHFLRKDKEFIHRHLDHPVTVIFTEYAVLTAPLTLPVLLAPSRYLFPGFLLCFWIIAHIQTTPEKRSWFVFLSRIIAPRDFEWLSGMRKGFLFTALLIIAALGLSWVMIAPLVCLWLVTVTICSFYLECEPLSILWANEQTPGRLLRAKIKRHGFMLMGISVPVIVANSLFNPGMIWINAGFLIAQLLLLVFAILLKYATYRPGSMLSGNNILLGFAAISIVIPFLLPVPLLMSIRNYGRALTNLKTYIHDSY